MNNTKIKFFAAHVCTHLIQNNIAHIDNIILAEIDKTYHQAENIRQTHGFLIQKIAENTKLTNDGDLIYFCENNGDCFSMNNDRIGITKDNKLSIICELENISKYDMVVFTLNFKNKQYHIEIKAHSIHNDVYINLCNTLKSNNKETPNFLEFNQITKPVRCHDLDRNELPWAECNMLNTLGYKTDTVLLFNTVSNIAYTIRSNNELGKMFAGIIIHETAIELS